MARFPTSPNLDTMIERQVRLWDVRRRLAEEGGVAARRELVHLEQGPWVTISKQCGAGGERLARRLGERLGWQVFDKEILSGIAEHAHLRERVLSRVDETVSSWISDLASHLLEPGSVSSEVYVREMVEVVLAIAREGRAVLVGRGINWVLDPRYGLRLRVVADEEVRARAVATVEGLGLDDARDRCRSVDGAASAFVRKAFAKSVDDPSGYDLWIASDRFHDEAVLDVVVTALAAKLDGGMSASFSRSQGTEGQRREPEPYASR